MRSFFAILMMLAFLCGGCAKPKRLSMEEEYRQRQERRQREARKRRSDRITSLSGLNDRELDALEQSNRENDLNPKPGSFVYSPFDKNMHSTDRVMKDLNESGRKKEKEYRKNIREKNKSGKGWVYGL